MGIGLPAVQKGVVSSLALVKAVSCTSVTRWQTCLMCFDGKIL